MKRLIIIDPGHGGQDPGSSGGSLDEKGFTLAVAIQCARVIGAHPDCTPILTRSTDVYVGLTPRANVANNAMDLFPDDREAFVSIHVNSAVSPKATGHAVFHATGSVGGLQLATAVHAAIRDGFPDFVYNAGVCEDEAVAGKRITVLRKTKCPACLVEFGFISNPADRMILMDPETPAKLATCIGVGVLDFLDG